MPRQTVVEIEKIEWLVQGGHTTLFRVAWPEGDFKIPVWTEEEVPIERVAVEARAKLHHLLRALADQTAAWSAPE